MESKTSSAAAASRPSSGLSRDHDRKKNSTKNTTIVTEDEIPSSGAAIDLLKHTSWRSFFTSSSQSQGTPVTPKVSSSPMMTESNKITNHRPKSAKNLKEFPRSIKTGDDSVISAFQEMVKRVEVLWLELKVPPEDRVFYNNSLLKGPPSSLEQCQELSRYLLTLKTHRNDILAIMRAIEIREDTISNCLNLLHVIYNNSPKDGDQKNMNSDIHLYKNNGNNNTSFESLQDIANMNSIDISEDDKIFSSYRNDSNLYQKEFIEVLREVQFASLDVIRLIQLCRRNMWRPNPIIYQKEGYQDCNYLIKMSSDLDFLKTDFCKGMLQKIPLDIKELLCITYSKKNKDDNNPDKINNESKENSSANKSAIRENIFDEIISGENKIGDNEIGEFKIGENEIGESKIGENKIGEFDNNRSTVSDDNANDSSNNPLRNLFFLDKDLNELISASRVVEEEKKLQKDLQTENRSLYLKSVFIPLLRMNSV